MECRFTASKFPKDERWSFSTWATSHIILQCSTHCTALHCLFMHGNTYCCTGSENTCKGREHSSAYHKMQLQLVILLTILVLATSSSTGPFCWIALSSFKLMMRRALGPKKYSTRLYTQLRSMPSYQSTMYIKLVLFRSRYSAYPR